MVWCTIILPLRVENATNVTCHSSTHMSTLLKLRNNINVILNDDIVLLAFTRNVYAAVSY